MTDNLFTFYPEFQESVTLFRGIESIWIADGTAAKPGKPGYIYARFVNGQEQELDSVLGYEIAKTICEAKGITLTYSDWIETILDAPVTAAQIITTANDVESNKTAVESLKSDVEGIKNVVIANKDLVYDGLEEVNNRIDLLNNETTASITYQNSTSGTVVPTAGVWADSPNPVPGYFTWTKVVLSWPGLSNVTFYCVSGYKEPIATMEEIESQFPEYSDYNTYATVDQIKNLFPSLITGDE